MSKLIIFGILFLIVTVISWRTIFDSKTHGFYRYFSWVCMSWLFASNYKFWFFDPFNLYQIISWILLFYSLYLVIAGGLFILLKGKPSQERNEKNLFGFEKTTELVETGVFRYTRHPLYASLIFVTWGIYLKNPTLELIIFALLSTVFLYITSRYDEKECINYFGDKYKNYMKRTKMFIPFVF